MTDTIQDRLRRTTPARDAAFGVVGQIPVNPDGPDAAAHIDAQDAKIKALVEALENIKDEVGTSTRAYHIACAALAAEKEAT